MKRDYKREHAQRDQVALKRLRGRQYQREIERALALGISVVKMRRLEAERRQREQALS